MRRNKGRRVRATDSSAAVAGEIKARRLGVLKIREAKTATINLAHRRKRIVEAVSKVRDLVGADRDREWECVRGRWSSGAVRMPKARKPMAEAAISVRDLADRDRDREWERVLRRWNSEAVRLPVVPAILG